MRRPRLSWSRTSRARLRPVQAGAAVELKPKRKTVNLRISEELLDAVRADAKRAGVSYQRYIRQALEQAVAKR